MEKRIQQLVERLAVLEEALGQPDVFDDQEKYRELTKEHSYCSQIATLYSEIESTTQELADNRELLAEEKDEEFCAVLREEIQALDAKIPSLWDKMKGLLVPPGEYDDCNTIIELRAGTGGDGAALFVGDAVRMYQLFADSRRWSYECLGGTSSEAGGYKEYVMVVSGKGAYRHLQFEGGTHRVQRVPATESQGRVHTSAITIAVLLEPDKQNDIVVEEKDLRVDTYRASGAGGQHVNTTDSAVRLTHIPTGIVVYCSDEKSQHKNKDRAMRLLKAKILEEELRKQQLERANARAAQVGSGDRSERIRTYNFPQNRLTDHRINMTRYSLGAAMDGALDDFVEALVANSAQEQLEGDA